MHSAAQHEMGCSAGLRPAPAEATAEAEAKAEAKAGFLRDGGTGPVAGDAVNPSLGAWPRHPCRGHPRNRTHPAFDRFPRSVDPRHAWMNLCRITKSIGVRSVFQRKTDLTPCRSTFRPPGQSNRHRETVEGGAVSDCGVSAAWMPRPRPHGRVYGVPAIRHRPAKPQTTQSRFGFGFGSGFGCCRPAAGTTAGAGRSPANSPSPAHENDFTDFSKPSSLRHASTILRSSMRLRATRAKNRPPIA